MFKNNKGFILKLRKSRTFKGMTVFMIFNFVIEIIQPNVSLALTEGPSQPEAQKFEPFGTTQMVDVFSGDFNYNIPLFNLPGPNGGYPVNLSYHAGATMEDEASSTGLGWNINVGNLVRSMRGLPDEFKSSDDDGDDQVENIDSDGIASSNRDYLEVQSDMKQSWTLGTQVGLSHELFGAEGGEGMFNLGASIYYNNYNGVGLSIDPSFGIGGSGSINYNVGLSIDTENGMGVNASMSLKKEKECNNNNSYRLGVSFDGNLSLDYSIRSQTYGYFETIGSFYQTNSNSGAVGSSISFARNNYIPSTAHNIDKYNLGFSLKSGIAGAGYFNSSTIGLFYNTEDYSDIDKKGKRTLVVGYGKVGSENNEQHSKEYTKDFFRENDGQITKSSMFLPVSQYAYDVFNSSGQGLIGYFRTKRSDIGRTNDPKVINNTIGINGTIEYGGGPGVHAGFGVGGNFGWDSQGSWDDDNSLDFDFLNPEGTGGNNENVYYKVHGEQTILESSELNYINGLDLPFVRLTDKSHDPNTGGKRTIGNDFSYSNPNNYYKNNRNNPKRIVRNTLVHSFNNEEVKNLGEFNVKYFDNSLSLNLLGLPSNNLDRTVRNEVLIDKHPAGYKVLNQEGSYYVYGLPTYNQVEVENLFSYKTTTMTTNEQENVPLVSNQNNYYKEEGTNKFIHRTKKSPYAHSYLLTSVLGADYIDLTNNGATDDDKGYWVKFNYVKYANNYKWRTPYNKNQFVQGSSWTETDDKASYQYGEKEMWYLGQIETKSHIAVFKMSLRTDMKEAEKEFSNSSTSSQLTGYKIDEINVYEKKKFLENPANAIPLQTVILKYASTDTLCSGTPNSVNGKLTLKEVWFNSNGSTRGELNKYKFDYDESNILSNPNYSQNSYDSWGNYKKRVPVAGYEFYKNFPYVNQFNQNWSSNAYEPNYANDLQDQAAKDLTKSTQDQFSSVWCLKKISLPSGGQINVNYESDDYGYVQHKTANQMFKIEKLGDDSDYQPNEIYKSSDNANDFYDPNGVADEERRRIYFKLEEPIPVDFPNGQGNINDINTKVYNDYVLPMIQDENNQRNLYYKVKIRLIDNKYDYLSGYLPLEDNLKTSTNYNFGVKLTTPPQIIDGKSCYTYGYVTVKATKKKNGNYFDKYHPLALAGWTFLQTNAQMLLHNSQNSSDFDTPSDNDFVNKALHLASIIPSTASNFKFIRQYCHSKNMAQSIKLENSVIRLASPDKKKYGGGHRVKQISINDNWTSDGANAAYGQIYDYTIEENGRTISSGVAQYEPQSGGDENALKYPYYYFDKQTTHTNNNLFAEAPFNESLFPSPSVGYRKVTVRSINTQKQIDAKNLDDKANPAKGRIGGITVHQFYTAKEFPTIVEHSLLSEENNSKDVFNLPIIIPFIGEIRRNYYHGTQAFMIENNNMHGIPKSIETFELNDYKLNLSPITSTYYEYQTTPYQYGQDMVLKLDNNVQIIENNGTHQISGTRLMGVDVDLFTDQRQSKSFINSGSFNSNVDIPFVTFPVPSAEFWLTYKNQKSMFRTFVTNKVIHKTGILKRTVTKDLQASNESQVVAYDEKSGLPLVVKTKNEFGDEMYNYNIPAYYQYDGMGHAYRNINYNFSTVISNISSDNFKDNSLFKFIPDADQIDNLVRGDEMITLNSGKYSSSHSGTQTVVCFGSNGNGGNRVLTASGNYCVTYDDVKSINGVLKGYVNGVLTTVDTVGSLSVNTYTVSYDDYSPTSSNDYQKCYFLGWKYGDDLNDGKKGVLYGVIKLMNNLPDAGATLKFKTTLKVIRSGRRNHYDAMIASYLTKGCINNTSLNPYTLRTNSFDGSTIKTKSIPNSNLSSLAVLSASASLYKQDWSSNFTNDISLSNGYKETVDRDINPFLSGNSGIWRPYKAYTYVGNRKSSVLTMNDNTSYNPNLKEDGVFSNEVVMFSWDLGNMEDYVSQWEWVNESTKFSNDSYEIENVNRIGVYSSALYGYDNSLSIAVGGNASYFELGTDDFETANLDSDITPWTNENRQVQNHFNFYKNNPQSGNVIISESVNIKSAKYSNGTISFSITNPNDYVLNFLQNAVGTPVIDIKSTFGLSLVSESSNASLGNVNYFFNGTCNSAVYNSTTKVIDVVIKPYMHCFNEQNYVMPNNTLLHGKITLFEKRMKIQNNNYSTTISLVNNKAHTGKKSLKISSQVIFDQPMLRAMKNKKYVTSLWISRDKNKVQTFKEGTTDIIVPGSMNGSTFTPFTTYSIKYGKVIEGWQKIDVEFSSSDVNPIIAFKFNPGSTSIYVDDIRYSPKTGGISTYVYDPTRFWLKASLNVDNFATLFYYDEEGNLTVKKQETEKGIFTITESRGHIQEQ